MAHVSQQRDLHSGAGSHPSISSPTSEASRGQLRAQQHGWISPSLCETTAVDSPSTINEDNNNKKPPAIWGASPGELRHVCHMYTAAACGDAAAACLPGMLRASRLFWGREERALCCDDALPFLLLLLAWHGQAPCSLPTDPDLGFTFCSRLGKGTRSLGVLRDPAPQSLSREGARGWPHAAAALLGALRGRIGFRASGKGSQLLKSLICADKEGTEEELTKEKQSKLCVQPHWLTASGDFILCRAESFLYTWGCEKTARKAPLGRPSPKMTLPVLSLHSPTG